MVYSTHYYRFDAKSADDQRKEFADYLVSAIKERNLRKVPFYVGEFGFEPHGDAAVEADAVQKMNAGGVSWSAWTYKVIFGGGRSDRVEPDWQQQACREAGPLCGLGSGANPQKRGGALGKPGAE